jgi:hypothetical protein
MGLVFLAARLGAHKLNAVRSRTRLGEKGFYATYFITDDRRLAPTVHRPEHGLDLLPAATLAQCNGNALGRQSAQLFLTEDFHFDPVCTAATNEVCSRVLEITSSYYPLVRLEFLYEVIERMLRRVKAENENELGDLLDC